MYILRDISALRDQVTKLEGDFNQTTEKINTRRKQFHLLLHSISELQRALEEEDDGNDVSDGDEDEDEDDREVDMK